MRFIGVVETTWFVERLESSEIVTAAKLPGNQVFDRYKEKVDLKWRFWAETVEMPVKWALSGVRDATVERSHCLPNAYQ